MKKLFLSFLVIGLFLPIFCFATYGDTSTAVGKLYAGDGGEADKAYFDFPEGLCATGDGVYYIADTYNHVIRKINKKNIVSTLAGTGSYGDGVGDANFAEFAEPSDVDCDTDGNVVVADTANGKIKKVKNGQVYTLVEGLNDPEGVALDGNMVYFLDTGNNALKKVSLSGGTVRTR